MYTAFVVSFGFSISILKFGMIKLTAYLHLPHPPLDFIEKEILKKNIEVHVYNYFSL